MKTREEYLKHLKKLLYGWKDEIPKEIVPSTGRSEYKVRAAWLECVLLCDDIFDLGGSTMEEIKKSYELFRESLGRRQKNSEGVTLTNEENIRYGNEVLKGLIKYLECKK